MTKKEYKNKIQNYNARNKRRLEDNKRNVLR